MLQPSSMYSSGTVRGVIPADGRVQNPSNVEPAEGPVMACREDWK